MERVVGMRPSMDFSFVPSVVFVLKCGPTLGIGRSENSGMRDISIECRPQFDERLVECGDEAWRDNAAIKRVPIGSPVFFCFVTTERFMSGSRDRFSHSKDHIRVVCMAITR